MVNVPEQAKITIRVTPNAKKNEVTSITEGVVRIKITAPPVDGKANDSLVEFVSEKIDVPKRHISILKGHTSRTKVLAVEGLSQQTVLQRLTGQKSF